MQPLAPILLVRPVTPDEASAADGAGPSGSPAASANALSDLLLGQIVEAHVIAQQSGGVLAKINAQPVTLQMAEPPANGSLMRLQVMSTAEGVLFRALADSTLSSPDISVDLSSAEQLAQPVKPLPADGPRAPLNWPTLADAQAEVGSSRAQLVSLFETGLRQLLMPADGGSAELGQAVLTQSDINQANISPTPVTGANEQGLKAASAQADATTLPSAPLQLSTYLGWIWPEQAIEIELDRRPRERAVEDLMNACNVLLRLELPRAGRLSAAFSWTALGVRLQIAAGSQETAARLRQDSGQFLDLLASLQVRVAGLSIRHE